MDANRPIDTMRKKIFNGMALCGFGAGVEPGDGTEAPAGGVLACADGAAAVLSEGFSGGGNFLTGTTEVCFLCI